MNRVVARSNILNSQQGKTVQIQRDVVGDNFNSVLSTHARARDIAGQVIGTGLADDELRGGKSPVVPMAMGWVALSGRIICS